MREAFSIQRQWRSENKLKDVKWWLSRKTLCWFKCVTRFLVRKRKRPGMPYPAMPWPDASWLKEIIRENFPRYSVLNNVKNETKHFLTYIVIYFSGQRNPDYKFDLFLSKTIHLWSIRIFIFVFRLNLLVLHVDRGIRIMNLSYFFVNYKLSLPL